MSVYMNIYGNPSSAHSYGREARKAIENARKDVAKAINASIDQVFFLPSATAANNVAIETIDRWAGGPFITTHLEHPSVLRPIEYAWEDFPTYCKLDSTGRASVDDFRKNVELDIFRKASICTVCSETGAINPIRPLVDAGGKFIQSFHTDATQAVGHIPIDVKLLRVDMLTFGAHKFGGPRGVGVLYAKDRELRAECEHVLCHGGEQEKGVWPGTENTAAIVGCAAALNVAVEYMDEEMEQVVKLRDMLYDRISEVDELLFNTNVSDKSLIVPGILNVSVPGINGEEIVMGMDERGVAISSGSACSTGSGKPSEAILNLFGDEDRAMSSVRFSIGTQNTAEEIMRAADAFIETVEELRNTHEDN